MFTRYTKFRPHGTKSGFNTDHHSLVFWIISSKLITSNCTNKITIKFELYLKLFMFMFIIRCTWACCYHVNICWILQSTKFFFQFKCPKCKSCVKSASEYSIALSSVQHLFQRNIFQSFWGRYSQKGLKFHVLVIPVGFTATKTALHINVIIHFTIFLTINQRIFTLG